jgi:hypothetical protein
MLQRFFLFSLFNSAKYTDSPLILFNLTLASLQWNYIYLNSSLIFRLEILDSGFFYPFSLVRCWVYPSTTVGATTRPFATDYWVVLRLVVPCVYYPDFGSNT